MSKAFSYTPIRDWARAEGLRTGPLFAYLKAHQRLLLFSDGSMTENLELYTGSRLEVELKERSTSPLSPDAASYMGEDEGAPCMERVVWLTSAKERLVYAHAIIPMGCVEAGLLKELDARGNEPLGRILNEKKVLFTKEKLEVGVLKCEDASKELGLAKDALLLARRYIMLNGEPGRWVIKAAFEEVFSPSLVPAPL